jgi:hypothetical protein
MSKWLAVVALVLLVLSGAMGLRNLVVANAPTVAALNSSSLAVWANGPGPVPPIPPPPGGGHVRANGPGPVPPIPPPPGGGHVTANGPGPVPPIPPPPGSGH